MGGDEQQRSDGKCEPLDCADSIYTVAAIFRCSSSAALFVLRRVLLARVTSTAIYWMHSGYECQARYQLSNLLQFVLPSMVLLSSTVYMLT